MSTPSCPRTVAPLDQMVTAPPPASGADLCSNTVTSCPSRSKPRAIETPPAPAPTTRIRSGRVDRAFGTGSNLAERPSPGTFRTRLPSRFVTTPQSKSATGLLNRGYDLRRQRSTTDSCQYVTAKSTLHNHRRRRKIKSPHNARMRPADECHFLTRALRPPGTSDTEVPI